MSRFYRKNEKDTWTRTFDELLDVIGRTQLSRYELLSPKQNEQQRIRLGVNDHCPILIWYRNGTLLFQGHDSDLFRQNLSKLQVAIVYPGTSDSLTQF